MNVQGMTTLALLRVYAPLCVHDRKQAFVVGNELHRRLTAKLQSRERGTKLNCGDELPLSYDTDRTREPDPAPDRDWRDALYDARQAIERAEKDGDFEVCVRVARECLEEAEELKGEAPGIPVLRTISARPVALTARELTGGAA